MSFNKFIVNRDVNIDSQVRKIVERTYPAITQPDRSPVDQPMSTVGRIISPYESTYNGKERLVWGVTRMGSKRVVTL